jgi:Homeodomain-like domain
MERPVRGPDGPVRLRPRRSVCSGCERTHVLLPVTVLARRADAAVVIGSALVARARGVGHRPIAARLDRPESTVRGWLRRFAGRAEAVRAVFIRLLRDVDPDPVVPAAAVSVFADAVAAVVAVFTATGRRFGALAVSVWELAAAISGSRLLAPNWPT